jgi:peroxiredoxin
MRLLIQLALLACLGSVPGCNDAGPAPSAPAAGSSTPNAVPPIFGPGEQDYKGLQTEWEARLAKLSDLVNKAESQDAKDAANKGLLAERQKYADALIQFAQAHPNDSSSIDVLLRAAKLDKGLQDKALAVLAKNHVKDPKMATLGFYLGVTVHSPAAEKLLREVLAQNPDRDAQGNACYGLGRFYFKKYLDDTSARDAGRYAQEAEAFFAREADQYADVMLLHAAERKFPFAVVAQSRLYELRNLIAGKVAPEITGEDLDGKALKLSDYRGKVVVLNFWGSWCGPCVAKVPQDNEIVQRFQGRPFAFLGVCNDFDREKVKMWVAAREVNWLSWWDGGKDRVGPIAEAWHIASWPRLFIIDQRGVIRYAGDEGMTDRITALVEDILKETPAQGANTN